MRTINNFNPDSVDISLQEAGSVNKKVVIPIQ